MQTSGLTPLKDILSLADSFGGDFSGLLEQASYRIPVDVYETRDDIFVEALLGGFEKDRVQVEFSQGRLNIRAERLLPQMEARWIHTESAYGTFYRSIYVGPDVREADMEATWSEGVLRVRLPKVEQARPKVIPIKEKESQVSLNA